MDLVTYKQLTIDRSRPVVFLDIDGVFNGGFQHEHLFDTFGYEPIIERPSHRGDYLLANLLRPVVTLFHRYRVQVIVVSSWFQDYVDAGDPQTEELRGLTGMDVLGSLNTGGGDERGRAVSECLDDTGLTQWLVLDDCDHFYQAYPINPSRIVAPSGRYGLQMQDMEMLYRLLEHLTA